MSGKNLSKIKQLMTSAVSIPTGLMVTFPNVRNKTIAIESPIETFISSLVACQIATLRALVKKSQVKLGHIVIPRIQSSYDLNHWFEGGGPNNKPGDISIETLIQTNIKDHQLHELKIKTEKLCPIYQMVIGSGIKINNLWINKKIGQLSNQVNSKL